MELWAAQLPGRPPRMNEPPSGRLGPMLDQLERELAVASSGIPCALFGHSMGAIVAFELARRMRRRGLCQVSQLFVSGCRAPQLRDCGRALHRLPDRELVEELGALGGLPAAVAEQRELLELFLPIIRSDSAGGRDLALSAGAPALQRGLCAGRAGRPRHPVRARGLASAATGDFSLQLFPGDHFFINSSQDLVLDLVQRRLSAGVFSCGQV